MSNFTSKQELLTIIIPTKDRPYLLNRSLYYYTKADFMTRIIVADSSNKALLNETKKICNKYSDRLTIDYFNVDVDTEISEKQHIAAEMVTTPYLLLIGDDDFPLKSTIEDILIELEKDKSIVAAFGQRVAITQIDNKTSGFKWVKSCPNYRGISITNSNALDRMRKQPIPMWQQYPNSVFRTKPYQKAFKMVGKLEHTQYAEFFTQSFILSYGKWVKYNKLFSVCHQESKFCRFKDRYLFPYYIGKNGSVLSGISQNKWSKTVSLLCDLVGKEIAAISQQDSKDISFQIRKIYYSKLVYYLECNNSLSNNLIDSDSTTLKIINNALRKIGKFYWTIVLYDRSGGIYEFIIFLFGFFREIINGRFIRLALKSTTSSSIKDLLISIKRTGSLDYESDVLLHASSKYHKEYKIIFDVWTKDPCPQQLEENLHNN